MRLKPSELAMAQNNRHSFLRLLNYQTNCLSSLSTLKTGVSSKHLQCLHNLHIQSGIRNYCIITHVVVHVGMTQGKLLAATIPPNVM